MRLLRASLRVYGLMARGLREYGVGLGFGGSVFGRSTKGVRASGVQREPNTSGQANMP